MKFYAAAAIVATALIMLLVFRKSVFSDAKEKLHTLISLRQPVTVKDDTEAIKSRELLEKYFRFFEYQPKWTDTTSGSNAYRTMLLEMLNEADSLGLNRADYHQDYVAKFDSLSHLANFDMSEYESENELIFTDAAVSFLFHVAYGKEIPRIEYNGVKYNIDSGRIVNVLNDLLQHHNWRQTLDSIEPKTAQYLFLKSELNRMQAFVRGYPAIDSMPVADTDTGRIAAIIKLKAFSCISDSVANDSVSKQDFSAGITKYQKMIGLDATGIFDAKAQAALNYPVAKRIEQLKESLNYWRWTGRLKDQEFILVNIPAARLQVVTRDTVTDMSMRVIVGKKDTKTPSFTAYITRVIAYPYWTVPISIATKEMLPKIRKRISYLD
ncbi:MAG: L,D-transpeptidase family protein, partial [Chitinophagales bacterium]|nr:L,D-transpeptidase family protein [Chitinophagales bacterium]